MTLAVATRRKPSVADYLRAEYGAKARHEYVDGEIRAMAGGTYRHSLVCLNIGGELRNRLKGKPCRASEANTRVASVAARSYVYPDVTVICGPPAYDPADKKLTTVLNPTLVVEVLSDGTEAFDRGDKFSIYQGVPSLKEYVLVSLTKARVETYFRGDDGTWSLATFSGLKSKVKLRALQLQIPMAEIYDGAEVAS